MNPISNPFEKLLEGLAEAQIEFITVGGIACALNGHVRTTEDVDILIKRAPSNIRKLLDFLANYGEGFGKELIESDFDDEEGAIRVIEDFPIDIFTVMAGNHFEDFEKYTAEAPIGTQKVKYLNKDGLILLKENSLREKDRMDVLQLKQLK